MSKLDVILVNPPSAQTYWYKTEHLGLAYLASLLRKNGYEVDIIDADLHGLTVEQVKRRILKHKSVKVIGATLTKPESLFNFYEIVAGLRQQGVETHITAGGYLATFWYDKVLTHHPCIDSIVLAEGEMTLLDLVESISNGKDLDRVSGIAYLEGNEIIVTDPRPLIHDLDNLPFPARDHLSCAYHRYYLATVYASRGCYYRCGFCQIGEFYRLQPGQPYRARSPQNVADEVEKLVRDHGVRYILFVDDDFFGAGQRGKKRIGAIADEFIKRDLDFTFGIQCRVDNVDRALFSRLKQAGLVAVFLGIESSIDRVLQDYNKQTNHDLNKRAITIVTDLGIKLIAGSIIFDALTSMGELKQTTQFFKEQKAAIPPALHELVLLRGTSLERTYRQQNLVRESGFALKYRIEDPVLLRFSHLVSPQYHRVYGPTVGELYRMYFLYAQFNSETRHKLRDVLDEVEDRVRGLHLTFLESAIEYLESGNTDRPPAFLNHLEQEYAQVYTLAHDTAKAWLATLKQHGILKEPREVNCRD